MKKYLLILLIFPIELNLAQLSTQKLDDFNRNDNTSVGSTPTNPTSLTWNESETAISGLQISSNKLVAGSTTSGREWCYVDMSGVSGYPTTLNTAGDIVTWAINMKTTRSDLSGFGNDSYGIGFILASSTSTDVSTGTGYAVIVGGTGSPDLIRLARFTGGFNASSDFINIISGGSLTNEYLSIRVTYNPTGNNWSLYVESNSLSYPQSDPRNTSTQIGSTTSNSTYVGSVLNYFGVLWNHGIASESAEFDDVYVSDPNGVLPVQLTSFTANVIGNKVRLNWQTAMEVNNYGFEIQRLAVSNQLLANSQELNAYGWSKIGFVQGYGNSNSPKNYSFTDKPMGGGEFKYRLKQIDFDGAFEYSKEVYVLLEDLTQFILDQNYPNPFNPITKISYTIPQRLNVRLRVYDMIAKEVAELVNGAQEAGRYEVTFDGSNLPSGAYFYKLEAGRFVEVKKLLLIK